MQSARENLAAAARAEREHGCAARAAAVRRGGHVQAFEGMDFFLLSSCKMDLGWLGEWWASTAVAAVVGTYYEDKFLLLQHIVSFYVMKFDWEYCAIQNFPFSRFSFYFFLDLD